jgi:hypothetical protein
LGEGWGQAYVGVKVVYAVRPVAAEGAGGGAAQGGLRELPRPRPEGFL